MQEKHFSLDKARNVLKKKKTYRGHSMSNKQGQLT